MGIGGLIRRWRAGISFSFPILCALSAIFVLLRGSISHLLGIEWLDIDLIPIVLIYLLGKDQELRAGFLAFCMGTLTDILTPAQLGLFALTYCTITLGLNHCRQFLDFTNIKTSALFVAMYLLTKWAFVLVVLRLFTTGNLMPSTSFISVFLSALITSLLAPPLFYLMDLAGGGRASGTLITISGNTHGGAFGL
jgi:rod shape-determining protein MreD